jgi:serine protease inhibitor
MIHPIIKCIWFLTSVLIIAKAQVSKVDLDQAQPKDSISQDRMVPNYNPMFPGPHRAMVPNMNVNPYWSSRHPRHSGQKTSQWWQQLFMLQQRTQQQVVEILARLVQLEKRINVMSGCEKESMNSINLGKASAEIGIKLYNEEKKKKAGNLLFSPFSIQSALSLLALGSKGSTLNQIMDLVGGNNIESLQELKSQFGRALSTIKSSDQYTIESVNSLFVQENYKLKQSFVTDLKDNFGADIRTTNYAKPKAAADLINTYVEKKTHGKILDLISPSILGADTKIVLINALYFKGMWKQPFDKKKTSKQVFHLTDKKSIEIDFMNQEGDMKVGSYQGRTIVALPYTGDRFVMYLFIPHNIKPLSVLEELMVADSTRLTEALDIKVL